jgi:ribosomal protein L11 methyltransferase
MPSEPVAAPPAQSATWILDLAVEAIITPPSAAPLDREAFFGWLWDQCGEEGLMGVFEGAIDTVEAAALGLVESPRVIDAAAAPPERDWVGSVAAPPVACWFADEIAARAAVARLADVRGCEVRGLRRESGDHTGNEWRAGFTPIDVPGFGTIRPAWEPGAAEAAAAEATIFIEPGAGFGTGQHETTRLCLEALAVWRGEGGGLERVLDVGSGSGILGIAAAVCGGGRVDSIEIDPLVHDAIRANARRNGVADRVHVAVTLPDAPPQYDLVFANIVAAVLLEHAAAIGRCMTSGTPREAARCLVLSGLLADDLPVVADRYSRLLGVLPVRTSLGDWHCLRFVVRSGVDGALPCR